MRIKKCKIKMVIFNTLGTHPLSKNSSDTSTHSFPKMLFYAFLAQLLLALCSSSILMLCCGCCKRNKSKNQRVTRTRGRPIVTNRPPNKIPATTRDKNNKPADSDGTKKDADATSQKTQKKSTRTTKTAQISLKDVNLNAEPSRPKKFALDDKEKRIKDKGLTKAEGGYPTIEHMLSDRSIRNETKEKEGTTATSKGNSKGAAVSNVKKTQQDDGGTMTKTLPTPTDADDTQP